MHNYSNSIEITQTERFCIISAYSQDLADLVKKINEMLGQGWILSGGLTASNSRLYQALIKK